MTLDVCWHVSLRHTSCGSSPKPTLLSCLADVLQKKISSRSLIWKCAAIPDESNRKTTGVCDDDSVSTSFVQFSTLCIRCIFQMLYSSATTLHMFVLRLPILLHEFGDNRQTLIKETSRVVIQKHCSAAGYRISRSSSIF